MIQPVQTTQSKSPIKIAAKAVATATVAAGTILYLAKKGKLNPAEGDNIIIKNVKSGLRKPANFLLNKGASLLEASKDKFAKVKETVSNIKKDVMSSDLKGTLDRKLETLKDFIESKFNKEKFMG